MKPQAKLVPVDTAAGPGAGSLVAVEDVKSYDEGYNKSTISNSGKGIGLALSGGGFRATLFHLGVVAFLRDSNRLKDVTHITSVSGGSILAAHLVLKWDKYTGTQEDFEQAAGEIYKFVRRDVRGRVYRRAPMHLPFRFLPQPAATVPRPRRWFVQVPSLRKTTTDLLIDHYSQLYDGETLEHLDGDERPQLYLLTTNQTDGTLCSFCRHGFRDEQRKREFEAEAISLARAVAASSAFPGLFPPVALTPRNSGIPQRDLGHPEVLLTDGGVYDNLGLRKFHFLLEDKSIDLDYVVVSDASAEFKVGHRGGVLEPLRTSLRAADILTKRINELERRFVSDDKFKLVYIGKIIKKSIDPTAMAPVLQRELVSIRTDLDKFSQLEIAALVRHGYCVARERLEDGVKNGAGERLFKYWDPLPSSKHADVVALRDSRRKETEHLRQLLDAGSQRKLRLASLRDGATYLQAFGLVAIALAYFFLPSAYGKFIEANIATQVSSLNKSYREQVIRRQVSNEGRSGFAEGKVRDSVTRTPIETWNTSQATYALIKSGELQDADVQFLVKSIKDRFTESQRGDYVAKADGWNGRPSLRHIQAEPAMWTGAAIAALLQQQNVSSQDKAELKKLLDRVRVHLINNKFYDPNLDGPTGFNVFGNQQDTTSHSAYSTSLALMMLTEVHRAGLQWGDQDTGRLMNRILNWLDQEYVEVRDTSGWRSMDADLNGELSEATTLQILAVMVEAYQELGRRIPYRMHSRVRDHLFPLEAAPEGGVDSAASARITVNELDGTQSQAEPQISFLWRPWAIRLCRLWIQHAAEHEKDGEREMANERSSEFRNLLYRLIVDEGQAQFEAAKERSTFVSSEMLFAHSPLPVVKRNESSD